MFGPRFDLGVEPLWPSPPNKLKHFFMQAINSVHHRHG